MDRRFDRDYDRGYDRDYGRRDYGERDFGRMGGRNYDRDYGYSRGEHEGGYGHDYGRDERGFLDRASDEVRSWFGDDEAERRRRMDERYDRDYDRYDRAGGDSRSRRSEYYGPNHDRGSEGAYGQSYGRGADFDRSYGYGRGGYGRRRGSEQGYGARSGYGGEYGRSGYDRDAGAQGRYGSGYSSDYNQGSDLGSTYTYTEYWLIPGPMSGRGPEGYQQHSTERLEQQVCERLAVHGRLDASNVRVSVDGDEVTLEGTVNSRRDKREAENVAESVSGVSDVHNRLRVRREPEAGEGATGGANEGTKAGTSRASRPKSGSTSGSTGTGERASSGSTNA